MGIDRQHMQRLVEHRMQRGFCLAFHFSGALASDLHSNLIDGWRDCNESIDSPQLYLLCLFVTCGIISPNSYAHDSRGKVS
jgi:hypothetical protein